MIDMIGFGIMFIVLDVALLHTLIFLNLRELEVLNRTVCIDLIRAGNTLTTVLIGQHHVFGPIIDMIILLILLNVAEVEWIAWIVKLDVVIFIVWWHLLELFSIIISLLIVTSLFLFLLIVIALFGLLPLVTTFRTD